MSTQTLPPPTDWPEDDAGFTPPPPRPRRRLVTPATGALAGVLVAAIGFLAGVEVQKSGGGSTTSAGGLPSFANGGGPPSFAGAGGRSAGSGTSGTVSYVKGGVLYVKDTDGNTVKVKVGDGAKVTRTAATKAGQVHPGDTVTVQGKPSGSTVTATSVTATSN